MRTGYAHPERTSVPAPAEPRGARQRMGVMLSIWWLTMGDAEACTAWVRTEAIGVGLAGCMYNCLGAMGTRFCS